MRNGCYLIIIVTLPALAIRGLEHSGLLHLLANPKDLLLAKENSTLGLGCKKGSIMTLEGHVDNFIRV